MLIFLHLVGALVRIVRKVGASGLLLQDLFIPMLAAFVRARAGAAALLFDESFLLNDQVRPNYLSRDVIALQLVPELNHVSLKFFLDDLFARLGRRILHHV